MNTETTTTAHDDAPLAQGNDMATKSVTTQEHGAYCLPFEDVDAIGDLCAQACGIAACIGAAFTSSEQMPSSAGPNAAWALQQMIERIEAIATKRRGPVDLAA